MTLKDGYYKCYKCGLVFTEVEGELKECGKFYCISCLNYYKLNEREQTKDQKRLFQ